MIETATLSEQTSIQPEKRRIRIAVALVYFSMGLCFSSWASRIPDIKTALNLNDALFGSILFISNAETLISFVLAVGIVILVIFFYNDLFSITFDENFAKISGIKVKKINYLLSIFTSITIVLGIRIVGTLLISSLIVFPSVSALQVSRGFKETLLFSLIFSSIITSISLS